MDQTNVIPIGELRDWQISTSVSVDRSAPTIVTTGVQRVDFVDLDFSQWLAAFDSQAVQKIAVKRLNYPLKMVVQLRTPSQAVVAAGGRSAANVELHVALRHAHSSTAFPLSLPKFKLCFSRDIAPMLKQAMARLGTGQVYLGAVNTCDDPQSVAFLKWGNDSRGSIALGKLLEVHHRDGMIWRFRQSSADEQRPQWELLDMELYLTDEDLAGAEPRVNARFVLNGVDGDVYQLAALTQTTRTWTEENPFAPQQVVRVFNASQGAVPLQIPQQTASDSAAQRNARPWEVELLFSAVEAPRRIGCHGEFTAERTVVHNVRLRQADLALGDSPPDVGRTVLAANTNGVEWYVTRRDAASVNLMYAIVKL